MSRIDFFTPVLYDDKNKTLSQHVLEVADEIFYLGGKFRVRVCTSNPEHLVGIQTRQDRDRSWFNIALKVALYCTLIFPLIGLAVKATLRLYLEISVIKVQSNILEMQPNRIKTIPKIVWQSIGSFMDAKDEKEFEQSALFAHDAIRSSQQYFKDFQAEIEALPKGLLQREDFQKRLLKLLNSPDIGYSKYWIPVMNSLMKRVKIGDEIEGFIQSHSDIADILVQAKEPISPERIYQFCKYMTLKYKSNKRPWVVYRMFEKYLKLNQECVQRALQEYLVLAVHNYIGILRQRVAGKLPKNRSLEYLEMDIDPRIWFGGNEHRHSLWVQPKAKTDETTFIPKPLLEALWSRIQSLRNSYKDYPFQVTMTQRLESKFPRTFTLQLAQRITNAQIFLVHVNSVQNKDIQNVHYAQDIYQLSQAKRKRLAKQYPQAVSKNHL